MSLKVIAAKTITDRARLWLTTHGATIEHLRTVEIVFLPSPLRLWASEWKDLPGWIDCGNSFPGVYVGTESDDEREIYTAEDGEEEAE